MKILKRQSIIPVKKTSLVKQYSWETEGENGQSEGQMIAESWMVYFGNRAEI